MCCLPLKAQCDTLIMWAAMMLVAFPLMMLWTLPLWSGIASNICFCCCSWWSKLVVKKGHWVYRGQYQEPKWAQIRSLGYFSVLNNLEHFELKQTWFLPHKASSTTCFLGIFLFFLQPCFTSSFVFLTFAGALLHQLSNLCNHECASLHALVCLQGRRTKTKEAHSWKQ